MVDLLLEAGAMLDLLWVTRLGTGVPIDPGEQRLDMELSNKLLPELI